MLPERLASKIEVADCWYWTGRLYNGYGKVQWDGKQQPAHRVVWQILVGLPAGDLDHLCRVRHCVNPDHLEEVSRAENVRRSPLSKIGSTHCNSGHERSETTTYTNPTTGARRCRVCQYERNRSYLVEEKSNQH